MSDINKVILIGRLTRDAELKYLNNGTAVSNFSIANNKYRKDQDEKVNFFDFSLYGKRAEGLNQYLLKGTQICIEGELNQQRWEQDGAKRSKVDVVAINVQLLGSKIKSENTEPVAPDFEDDIPF